MSRAREFRVRFVSFEMIGNSSTSSTLMPGQDAQDWQIELLEDYLTHLKGTNHETESPKTQECEFI